MAQIDAEIERLNAQRKALEAKERQDKAAPLILGFCKNLKEDQMKKLKAVYEPLYKAVMDYRGESN